MPAGLRRYDGKGHVHFITFRCYRRLPLLKSAQARDIFVRGLAKLREEWGFRWTGYVVMPEHVHWLMSEPQRGTPSSVLQKRKLRVARKMRKRRRSALGVKCVCLSRSAESRCARFGSRDFTISMCRFYAQAGRVVVPIDV
jgi:REP element-mobilizing transposase RayT